MADLGDTTKTVPGHEYAPGRLDGATPVTVECVRGCQHVIPSDHFLRPENGLDINLSTPNQALKIQQLTCWNLYCLATIMVCMCTRCGHLVDHLGAFLRSAKGYAGYKVPHGRCGHCILRKHEDTNADAIAIGRTPTAGCCSHPTSPLRRTENGDYACGYRRSGRSACTHLFCALHGLCHSAADAIVGCFADPAPFGAIPVYEFGITIGELGLLDYPVDNGAGVGAPNLDAELAIPPLAPFVPQQAIDAAGGGLHYEAAAAAPAAPAFVDNDLTYDGMYLPPLEAGEIAPMDAAPTLGNLFANQNGAWVIPGVLWHDDGDLFAVGGEVFHDDYKVVDDYLVSMDSADSAAVTHTHYDDCS